MTVRNGGFADRFRLYRAYGDSRAAIEQLIKAIAETADELDKTEAEVRDNVAYIMDSTFEEEGVSTSFNEMVSGAALEDDIGSTGNPRLEALEMYKLRQKL